MQILKTRNEMKLIQEQFINGLKGHQIEWFKASHYPIRNIIKARQIGATFYFAREALIDALANKRHQVFFTENIFSVKEHILKFAVEIGVDVHTNFREATSSEDDAYYLTVAGGAKIYICNNLNVIKSKQANVYFDEYFYIPNFEELHKSALEITNKNFNRLTFYSSLYDGDIEDDCYPHYAHNFWVTNINTNGELLKAGMLCSDGQFRQVVNIDSLEENFTKEMKATLISEYGQDVFDKLYMCNFN